MNRQLQYNIVKDPPYRLPVRSMQHVDESFMFYLSTEDQ